MSPWEIYALRYAEHDRQAQENFLLPSDMHDLAMPMDYFIWVLRSGTSTIVVDTGFSPDVGARRGRRTIRSISDALAQLGIDAAQVRDVIITHMHYDHAGNLDLFSKARFHVQEREMAFATGRDMCQACIRHPFEVEDAVRMVRAVYAERVIFYDGDDQFAEGVGLHRVGGHSAGLQMVRVVTQRGPVVLAGDASHFYANMERENPFPIFYDLGALTRGWQTARRLAGDEARIVPGHDPLVRLRYPAYPGSGGETVTLHLAPMTAAPVA